MNTELKPCPFCGGEPIVMESNGDFRESNRYAVVCTGCGIRTAEINERQMALLLWDRRINDTMESNY